MPITLPQPDAKPGGSRMKIDLIEGPIGTNLLEQIGDLYGRTTDHRYADVAFTHKVFNCNPAGRSYHAFAREGNEVIGCYTIIPFCLSTRGRTMWAGKAEALFVREDYRPTGLFLVNTAVNFAASKGLEFIFGLTHERLGSMLQKLGFTALSEVLRQRSYLLRPNNIKMLSGNWLDLNAARLLRTAQGFLEAAVTVSTRNTPAVIEVNRDDHRNHVFKSVCDADDHSGTRWTVATDERSLCWLNDIGKVDFLTVNGNPDEFVVVERCTRGGNAEILRWHVSEGGVKRALQVIRYVIHKAQQEGASALSVGANSEISGRKDLPLLLSILGFVPRRTRRTLYLKSGDPFYHDPRNMGLTSFVSI